MLLDSEQQNPLHSFTATQYQFVISIFFRGLAFIYFAAFASLLTQIEGLIGVEGILPIKNVLSAVGQAYPDSKWWRFPTLFWINHSDSFLVATCYLGMASSLLVFFNAARQINLLFCYVLYLSLTEAGQDFTAFQWDQLLLETGFLAIFLCWHSKVIIFLFRWLLARFMFMGGLVKVLSGDPSWHNLTALNYHYETQPLPSPLAYYAHHLPEIVQQISVAGVLFIELVVPFFIFLPRYFRLFAAWSFILLQLFIILTGNYTFFNLLTILLCLFLFEDRDIKTFIPDNPTSSSEQGIVTSSLATTMISAFWLAVVFAVCSTRIWMAVTMQLPEKNVTQMLNIVNTFSLVNNYGPFATMTKSRPEIVIEGSRDGKNWHEYGFKYKPGDLTQQLTWNIPHQPRLDWQMWFAALTPKGNLVWFDNFMHRLKSGSAPVLALLAHNPFPKHPPEKLRASLYLYHFNDTEQASADKRIWQREFQDIYWQDD